MPSEPSRTNRHAIVVLTVDELGELIEDVVQRITGRGPSSATEPRPDDILEAREVAALLGVSCATVRRRAARKDLPAFRVGRQWRFRRDAIMSLTRRG